MSNIIFSYFEVKLCLNKTDMTSISANALAILHLNILIFRNIKMENNRLLYLCFKHKS